jgi:hypothetical protein
MVRLVRTTHDLRVASEAACALRGWPDATKAGAPVELVGHDPAALGGQVWLFMSRCQHRYAELAAWSFELNDWIRMEAFEAPAMNIADALGQTTDFDFEPPRLTSMGFRAADFD